MIKATKGFEFQKLVTTSPDPTQAVNKRPTHLRPGYFLTQPVAIFLTQSERWLT